MHVLESEIEKAVVKWAKAHDIRPLKLTPQGETGFPDRLFLFNNGLVVFIEFKRPGERPRPLQEHRIRELQKRRFHVYVCDNYYEAVGILEAARVSEKRNAANDITSLRRFAPGSGIR